MKKVLVLLSTYNGERFLKAQLDSLLAQKGVEVSLLVRDDGSKDATLSILMEYASRYDRIEIFKGQNVGALKSFLILQEEALKRNASYYAFCDQDDVWMPEKLKTAVDVLELNKEVEKPALYMSAFQMVDEALNSIHTEIRTPNLCLPAAIISNCATGCTMVFNKSLLHAVACTSDDNMIMHDYWMYLVCLALNGFVYYDETPHILYRQHNGNVIGGLGDSFGKRWAIRIKKVFKKGDCFKSKLAAKLLETWGSRMKENDVTYLKWASTCSQFSSKVRMLTVGSHFGNSLDKDLQTFGLILSGKL